MNNKIYLRAKALLFLSLLCMAPLQAGYKKRHKHVEVCGNNEARCKDLNDSCQCYCAYKPGPRDKAPDDNPIFIENDPDEIYCYCKQRDIDKHRENQAGEIE